jgi:ribonuclease P protein component
MKTFKKEERLCSKRLLDQLFKNGSSFLFYPFRLTFLKVEATHSFPVQIVINVAKKRYKLAVDRNLIKRRTREAYRLQKDNLLYSQLADSEKLILLSIQYIGKEKHEYPYFEKKMGVCLTKLVAKLKGDEGS